MWSEILNYQLVKLANIEILWRLPVSYIQIKYIYFYLNDSQKQSNFQFIGYAVNDEIVS